MANTSDITNVAIYLRVSTSDQDTSLQARELHDFVRARGWIVVGTFEDKATGTNDRRPQLRALMEQARARRFDVVLVWKLDRWARSLKDLVTSLQELQDLGVQFVSLKDSIDMTTPMGRLMTHILAAFAEFEASVIRMRVRAGLENARHRGQRLGRPPRLDPFRVLEMRRHGLSLGAIGKQLGVTKSAVSKTLSRLAATKLVTNPEITGAADGAAAGDKPVVSETGDDHDT